MDINALTIERQEEMMKKGLSLFLYSGYSKIDEHSIRMSEGVTLKLKPSSL